ncbi:MAG: hypothetical protein EXS05_21265 [Planctomycetaceae bacterium]|nr:hypothetical protein [Planctomycetaceae bacterium]
MKSSIDTTGYSALVNLQLEVGDESFDLAQVGPNDIVFAEPTTLSPCEAQVVMQVDGNERRWHVELPNGASPNFQKTQINQVQSRTLGVSQ